MGFARDLAKVGTFGLVGLAASKKKDPLAPQPTMISNRLITERPTSMIGSTRGGY